MSKRKLNTLPLPFAGGQSAFGGGASNERERGWFPVYVSYIVTLKKTMFMNMPAPAYT